MHTLEAVLWVLYRTDDFKFGALKAVNLGSMLILRGAIYGQLAGAFYGERVIPFKWTRKIAEAHVFYMKAEELKDVVLSKRRDRHYYK
ncbi:MAG: ADP-ribosyl-[dinitrogen reductase] hydrolase [Moritella dasanensis]|jgi:ADP-ribosyl-[dinitrogen reductase] hydrolase